ncbi:MAG: methylated-DNA--[protein]-cysteine S-methyltransferase [Nitrospiria bacterium]
MKTPELFYDRIDSPLGALWPVACEAGLSYLFRGGKESCVIAAIEGRLKHRPVMKAATLPHWRTVLGRYFSGEERTFKGPVAFLEGTPFQQRVWRTLMKIPYGEVRSYQWIGEQLSMKHAGRAVGNACGKNPIPILLPCHRVIRQDGKLGGYTGGAQIKQKLLELESQAKADVSS